MRRMSRLVFIAETPEEIKLYFEGETVIVRKDKEDFEKEVLKYVDPNDEILQRHKKIGGFWRQRS